MAPDAPATRPGAVRAALLVLLVLLTLVAVGRMAMEAWLNRDTPSELPEIGARSEEASPLLIVILDGLREGTSWLAEGGPMPRMAALATEGASGIALTGEPTLTAACVRAILSGRRPDLLTGFRNFDAPEMRGTVIEYLRRRGANTAHAGDAAAWQVAKRWYPDEAAGAVFQVPDRGPVDQGETDEAAVPFMMKRIEAGDDVLTLHLTRIDHAGHKHGALGEAYAGACSHVDGQVAQVVRAFRSRHPDGTVLVASDHGVSSMGTHGGGEAAARRAPYLLVGPNVVAGARVDIDQSSLAPTIATLLGLPLPPLADAPPALEIVDLPPDVEDGARQAYLDARLAVARGVAGDAVDVIEKERADLMAKSWREQAGGWEGIVARVNELLEPRRTGFAVLAWLLLALGMAVVVAGVEHAAAPPGPRGERRREGWILGALLVLTLFVLGAFPLPGGNGRSFVAAGLAAVGLLVGARVAGRPGPRLVLGVLAALAFVPVLTACGYVLQEAFTLREDPGPATTRLAIVGGFALAGLIAFARPLGWLRRVRAFMERHPTASVALLGGPLGFLVTLRPFVDNVVHTVVIYALLGLLVVALWLRARHRAGDDRTGLYVVGGVALLLFGVLRGVEGWIDGNWVKATFAHDSRALLAGALLVIPVVLLAPRRAWRDGGGIALGLALLALVGAYVHRLVGSDVLEAQLGVSMARVVSLGTNAVGLAALLAALAPRVGPDGRLLATMLAAIALSRRLSVMDAENAAFVVVAIGAMGASRLGIGMTRVRVAWAALGLVVLRTAVFHAMGFEESFSTLDVGQAFAGLGKAGPAGTSLAATGVTWQIVAAGIQLALRMALPWVLFLAAVRRGLEARPGAGPAVGRQLIVDVAVAGAARAALVAAALWAWWRNTWWMSHAYTVYAYAAADIILLAVVAALLGFFGRDERAAGSVGSPA
ncbi:MAG: alkaline phosphatase family protein [Planctomycetes bacterium]|nr:alkaline phosphatase family protein [Planctomycetota bacterium]MCB9829232.1 alkaline phosphatase family protein [Planctomycetota bacterium]